VNWSHTWRRLNAVRCVCTRCGAIRKELGQWRGREYRTVIRFEPGGEELPPCEEEA
jgi:hypothetical protein